MYYSVKTLLENGKSISEIARTFNIDRKTVRKIKKRITEGEITPPSIVYLLTYCNFWMFYNLIKN